MLKNYLTIALRALRRQKGYTFINVAGLTVGMAACLLIAAWILYERSYDRFYDHAARLYRVVQTVDDPEDARSGAGTDGPLAGTLKETYPEIVDAGRLYLSYRDIVIRREHRHFVEHRVAGVDASFLEMFGFPFVYGEAGKALRDPFSIVLTQTTARKYFGDTNPVGREVVLDDEQTLTVGGVLADLPSNTHLRFDVLIPVDVFHHLGIKETDAWHGGDDFITYVLLQPDAQAEAVSAKIADEVRKHVPESRGRLDLQPLPSVHFDTERGDEFAHLDPAYLYLFAAIGLFILLVACVNFVNLSTARAVDREKEIGVRKVLGAQRWQVARQFLGESLLLACIAGVLALGLTELLLPLVGRLTGAAFTLSLGQKVGLLAVLAGTVLLAGLGAGSYPAAYLSSFSPASMLRGRISRGRRRVALRQSLVVFQFTLSIVLIVSTLAVYRQIHFMKNQKLGYDGDQLVAVSLTMRPGRSIFSEQYDAFEQELRAHPGITDVSLAASSPADIQTSAGEATWEGKADDRPALVHWYTVFYDFFKTAGLEIVEGRAFSRDHPSDELDYGTMRCAFVVNQAAARMIGEAPVVGRAFELYGKRGPIIGVVEDFHFGSLRDEIEPMALFIDPFYSRTVLVRVQPGQTTAALAHIEKTWDRMASEYPLEYHFVDEQYALLYEQEEQMARLLSVFAVLALGVACLGLFGLAALAAVQRTKEVGIRKVLGATVAGVILMLSKDFARLVAIAVVIGLPIAFLVTRQWLQAFAYRVDLGPSIFLLAGLLALGIALLTVSAQAVRAALTNPVDALRYE